MLEKRIMPGCLTEAGPEPREVKLGRSNDVKFVVESGLKEGEQVITNPRTHFSDEIAKLEAKFAEIESDKPKARKQKTVEETEETASAEKPESSVVAKNDKPAQKNERFRSVGNLCTTRCKWGWVPVW